MLDLFLSPKFLVLTFLSLSIAFLVSRHRRLHSVPGPLLASITDLWQAYYQNFDNFSKTLTQLHETYGSVVRVGPNRISISDASAVGTIYTMHGEFKKASSYHSLRALANGAVQGSMIDMDDEDAVTALRRAVGSAFSAKNVLDYENDVDTTAGLLIDRISEVRRVDLFQIFQQFQVDYLMKAAFSEETTFLKQGRDAFGLSFHARFSHWMRWQSMPSLEGLTFKPPYLRRFLRSPVPTWAQLAVRKLQARQAEKIGAGNEKADLLDKYLDAAEKHKDTVSPDIIRRMIASTISAGFDTTAFTMTTMIYFLLKNPQTLARLQQGIEDAVVQGQLSNMPSFHEADKLPYLGAVFKEAMRCYPFLALLLERVVPQGGATVAGVWLPGGTVVGCHPAIVHRDQSCFGADADAFRPERWLGDNKEERIAMERASLGFGSGKRVCLGRHLAELEIKKVIPMLLLKFKMSLADPDAIIEPMDNLTSFPKPIFVTFEERR